MSEWPYGHIWADLGMDWDVVDSRASYMTIHGWFYGNRYKYFDISYRNTILAVLHYRTFQHKAPHQLRLLQYDVPNGLVHRLCEGV
jgi:hypothetical protein